MKVFELEILRTLKLYTKAIYTKGTFVIEKLASLGIRFVWVYKFPVLLHKTGIPITASFSISSKTEIVPVLLCPKI